MWASARKTAKAIRASPMLASLKQIAETKLTGATLLCVVSAMCRWRDGKMQASSGFLAKICNEAKVASHGEGQLAYFIFLFIHEH